MSISECSDAIAIFREPFVDRWQVSEFQTLQLLLVKSLSVVAWLRVEYVDLRQLQVELVIASRFVEPDGLLSQLASLSRLCTHSTLLVRELAWNLHSLEQVSQARLR